MIAKSVVLGLCMLTIPLACGGSTNGPTTGGESHFLRRCDGACGDGLDCISNVCTRSCLLEQEHSCAGLPASATCTDQSIEPGNVAVCDVDCQTDADCAALGASHVCDRGFCRAPMQSTGGGPSTGKLAISPCPENIVSDPIDITQSHFEGDNLVLRVGHSGGCEQHDYSLCYTQIFLTTLPVQNEVHLIHDAHGDTCNAYLTTELSFDMTPLAEFYYWAFDGTGGLITVVDGSKVDSEARPQLGGLYAFGELSCDQRTRGAAAQATHVAKEADLSCTSASDCAYTSIDVSCAVSCGALTAEGDRSRIESTLQIIDETVCGNFAADGCPAPSTPPCEPPPPIDCIEGKCAIVE